jgi:hypothetical protein
VRLERLKTIEIKIRAQNCFNLRDRRVGQQMRRREQASQPASKQASKQASQVPLMQTRFHLPEGVYRTTKKEPQPLLVCLSYFLIFCSEQFSTNTQKSKV